MFVSHSRSRAHLAHAVLTAVGAPWVRGTGMVATPIDTCDVFVALIDEAWRNDSAIGSKC